MNYFSVLTKKKLHASTILKLLVFSIIMLVILTINGNILIAQHSNITAKDKKSIDAVALAYKSLGGQKLDSIKSIIITGNQKSGVFQTITSKDGSKTTKTGETACEFEIKILFPDDFIQISRCPDMNMVIYRGISNGNSFNISTTLKGEVLNRSTGNVSTELDSWSRLLAGMIMKGISTPLILFTDSNNDFIIERNGEQFGTMVFDIKDKWPIKIDYTATVQVPDIFKGSNGMMVSAGGLKSEKRSAYVQFTDRFSVDGAMFPKTIKQFITDRTDLTMTATDVKINPPLSKKDFEFPANNPK
jgi:hypothetical protein